MTFDPNLPDFHHRDPYRPPPPHPPQQAWPPPHPGWQAQQAEQEKAGLFKAGKIALWVWIVLAVAPVVAVLGCCGLCMVSGVLGAATPTTTPTP